MLQYTKFHSVQDHWLQPAHLAMKLNATTLVTNSSSTRDKVPPKEQQNTKIDRIIVSHISRCTKNKRYLVKMEVNTIYHHGYITWKSCIVEPVISFTAETSNFCCWSHITYPLRTQRTFSSIRTISQSVLSNLTLFLCYSLSFELNKKHQRTRQVLSPD